jgi:hypothetical protein
MCLMPGQETSTLEPLQLFYRSENSLTVDKHTKLPQQKSFIIIGHGALMAYLQVSPISNWACAF